MVSTLRQRQILKICKLETLRWKFAATPFTTTSNEMLELIMYSITVNFNFKPVCLLAFPKPDSLGKVTKVKSISEETKCVKEIHNW